MNPETTKWEATYMCPAICNILHAYILEHVDVVMHTHPCGSLATGRSAFYQSTVEATHSLFPARRSTWDQEEHGYIGMCDPTLLSHQGHAACVHVQLTDMMDMTNVNQHPSSTCSAEGFQM